MAVQNFILSWFVITMALTMTSSRKLTSSRHEPGAVIGYKQEKGGPILYDKENVIIEKEPSKDKSKSKSRGRYQDEDLEDDLENEGQGQILKVEESVADPDDETEGLYRPPQDLLRMMVVLTERMEALQHTVTNIKLQNHYIYRTLKKSHKECRASDNNYSIKSAAQKLEKPRCPSGYALNSDTDSCYKFAAERISWRMARERCRLQDADLVSIETSTEQRWINEQALKNPDTRHCDFWTGATDKTNEGDWRWISSRKALTFSNWNHNEPNNGRGDEHCMQMLWVFNWAWNDAHCNYHNACYICEVALGEVKQQ